MASKSIIINTNCSETRIAILEDGKLSELHTERMRRSGIVGNVYKGTVTRVLPGMNSAFVDIGMGKAAFLFGGDVIDPSAERKERSEFDPDAELDDPRQQGSTKPIVQLLREGQEVIVQVAKAPIGTKGPRVTTNLTVPGRYMVLLPQYSHVGISRRIEGEAERTRLRSEVETFLPRDTGVILRTAAQIATREQLLADFTYLTKEWARVSASTTAAPTPSLLFSELDLILRVVRDLLSEEVDSIVIDNYEGFVRLRDFLSICTPGSEVKLVYFDQPKPVFDEFGIEVDIGKALSSRVNLPSGGYLVIEQTEALATFDVNTGKFVGKVSAQDTILKTNLEAVVAISDQLKVRNIGGIIVVDFIDMESPVDRELIYNRLTEELKSDRARTNVLRVSELGLVQMTRKRTTESLERQLLQPCPHCDGSGNVRSIETETYDLIREIKRVSLQRGIKVINARVRPEVRAWIEAEEKELFSLLSSEFGIEVRLQDSPLSLEALRQPAFEVWI